MEKSGVGGKMHMGAISKFLEAVGNLKSSRLTPDHRTVVPHMERSRQSGKFDSQMDA